MTMQNARVVNIKSKSTALDLGGIYEAKIDGANNFRVLDGFGKWSKFAPNFFSIVTDPNFTLTHLHNSGIMEVALGFPAIISLTPRKVRVIKLSEVVDVADDWEDEEEEEVTELVELFSNVEELDDSTLEDIEEIEPYTPGIIGKYVEAVKNVAKISIKEDVHIVKKAKTLREFLMEQGVAEDLIDKLNACRKLHGVDDVVKTRIPTPSELFLGGEVWTAAITAVLCGQHILLQGGKATGKNVLTKCLAFAFGRPLWDISFHVNMDASSMIGAETFKNNEVQFRAGAVYECALHGGFGVLDEINMAKNEALAVLHSITDSRRVIDVPGYQKIDLHPATTFIGTMNYGYAGTRTLNEALTSRFVVINVPEMKTPSLIKLLGSRFPQAKCSALDLYAGLFDDIRKKAQNAEISTSAIDLRGLLAALKMTELGMSPYKALEYNVINKCFDEFERNIVADVVQLRIPLSYNANNVFGNVPVPISKTVSVNFKGVK